MSQEPVAIFIVIGLLIAVALAVFSVIGKARTERARLERDRAAIIESVRKAAERDG